MTTTPISKAERDVIFHAVGLVAPALAKALGREYFVAEETDCVVWTAHVEAFLSARAKDEQAIANRLRQADAARGIPARITFQAADAARTDLADFKAALEKARKEADERAAKRAADDAAKAEAKAKADAEADERPAIDGSEPVENVG